MIKNPFKFLDSYTKEDKDIFFGRDQETKELYQKIFESKLLLVYGVSGTGKSSLLQCGLANKFQDSDWLPISIRRGADINESLRKSITNSEFSITNLNSSNLSPSVETPKEAKKPSLKKLLKNLYLDNFKPIYLIFDQFEELFIFGSKTEKEEFIQSINKLLDNELQIKMIFVIREEYLANITEFEKVIPEFLQNRIRIEKMNRTNATQAIEGPCKVANIKVEEGFSAALLDKLSINNAEIELTYLQVFLDKIYRSISNELSQTNEGQLTFSKDILEKLGNVKDLLGSFLEEQIAELDQPDQGLVILKAFVSVKGTKRQITQDEVLDYSRTLGKNIPQETLKALIQKFVALRILRDKDENGRYELRHDALAAKIFEKISTTEKELLEIRQLIENAFDNYKKRDILLSANDLKYISKFEKNLFLSGEIAEFYNISKAYNRKQLKLIKQIMAVSILVFITLMGVLLYAGNNFINKYIGKEEAITSILQYKNPYKKMSVALDAYKKEQDNYLIKKAIFESYNLFLNTNDTNYIDIRNKYKINYEHAPSMIIKINTSKDGKHIYALTEDSSVVFWDTTGHLFSTIKLQHKELIDYKLSDSNKQIAFLYNDSSLQVYSVFNDSLFTLKIAYAKLNPMQSYKFFGDKLICISKRQQAIIYNMDGNIIQSLGKEYDNLNALDVSNDKNFIITSSYNTHSNIWYYNHIKKEYNVYNDTIYLQKRDTISSVVFYKDNRHILKSYYRGRLANLFTINNKSILEKEGWINSKFEDLSGYKLINTDFSPDYSMYVGTL